MTTTPHTTPAAPSAASDSLIEQLEDALVEWSGYVTADDAPRTLREHVSPHLKILRAELGRLHALAASPNTTASGAAGQYPSLYERTGNVEDINTLLVPRASLAAKAPAAPTQAEFALRALVAAGFVTQARADEALTLPGAPPAAEPVAAITQLWEAIGYHTSQIEFTGDQAPGEKLVSAMAAVEALIRTAPPAPTEQWRDIETAPRDNTRFLAYRPLAHLTHDPQITAVHGRTSDQGCWDETVPSGYDATNFTSGHCKATHWMPIPAPPQGAAKEATT